MTHRRSMVCLRIVSGDLMHSVEVIRFSGISIYNLRIEDELTARFEVNPFDYQKLRNIANKNRFELMVCNRIGYFSSTLQIYHRKILLLGCIVLLLLTLVIPTRVFFINIEGNENVETEKIKESAAKAGIGLGVSRRIVRSEKIKNALLESLPELQWAGVTTNGCVANISVKEKNMPDNRERDEYPEKIIAKRDGVIVYCNAVKGNLLCNVGQTVAAGETLVSGYIDCGRWIRKSGAEGEIYARTNRNVEVRFPTEWIIKRQNTAARKNFSLIIGKKRINLWKDSGIYDVTYDRIYKEYYTILPGGFQIPVALAIESCYQRDTENLLVQKNAISDWLTECAEDYLRTQMIAGEIEEKQVSLDVQNGLICLTGEYGCTEMIGSVQREEIGEAYG